MKYAACMPSRQITGVLAVVIVHVGLILALTSGLTVRIEPEKPDPTQAYVVPPKTPPVERPTVKRPDVSTWVEPDVPLPDPVIVFDRPLVVPDIPPIAVPSVPGDHLGSDPLPLRVDPLHPLTPPVYPPTSIRLNEEGRVLLLIHVLPDGRVGDVKVSRSSGHPRLDAAAIREARRSWRFQPAQTRGGQAIAAWGTFEVVFKLD